ncbi:guanitoxin biosynthesis pre-guanitoxin N-oxide kinase GntI [Paenibacillus paridis]|uniref:guanitoxin biosynthesis pre-guanitoxin N-oxide kinase GntI n=1 Tax=Paenibacillus paridis TaxID=2583376 RepID=UPI00111D2D0D|nr:guanitoxin biosynthesis pre-guanitoxin N-oxide kinase GntI [Paenibacillus paridis]
MANDESARVEAESMRLVHQLIKKELGWHSEEVSIEFQDSGLTNRNFIVFNGGEKVVVRIGGAKSHELGINRHAEAAALQVLDGHSIAPELLFLDPENGHMITRFVQGRAFRDEDLMEQIDGIVDLFKRIHQMPSIAYEFSPYRDIEDRIQLARARQLSLPSTLDSLVNKLLNIQHSRALEAARFRGFCHNDPFANNFLYDGSIRLLDWEYAGMGDILFDLACMGCSFTPNEKERLLSSYFGEAEGKALLSALDNMIFVVQFWNAMWATLQIGQPHPTHDYAKIADYMFKSLESQL